MRLKVTKSAALWAFIIVASSPFARSALNALKGLIGGGGVSTLIWCAFASILIGVIPKLRRVRAKNALFSLTLIAAGVLFAATFKIPEERVHLLKYGLLGFLIALPNCRGKSGSLILKTAILCGVVAAFDETVQYFLPDRVGDIRDVAFGIIGGAWGSTLQRCLMWDRGGAA